MRAAVYSGTRNIYQDMLVASKSLLEHSNVEKIYFLIEDDIFPYELPEEIECINISNQKFFPKDGPNYNNVCTYMVLIRAAYTKIFLHLDRILSIDIDTIVNENISELWDLDLAGYYIAAAEEEQLSKAEGSYFNMGVAMLNLAQMRVDHVDDAMIEAINTYWYRYKEQDCFNEFCRGKALILPSDYNVCIQARPPHHEKITHFAGIYKLNLFPHFNYYKTLDIKSLKRNQKDTVSLDIIIPTYKNKPALLKTLSSIYRHPHKNVNVIVVDDASGFDYTDILNKYPQINFYSLEKNSGPGCAREYGIHQGHGTYILFLDSGDYLYEDGLQTIFNEIEQNTYIKLFSFSYVYDDRNILCDRPGNKTIGNIFKRSFVEMYDIHFCEQGSYANEDYGFCRACNIIIRYLEDQWHFLPMTKHVNMPTFYEHIDATSLTKDRNNDFFYSKLPYGIITNGAHVIEYAKKNHISDAIIMEETAYVLAQEYYFFLCVISNRPELADDLWSAIREFYYKYYRIYIKYINPHLQGILFKVIMPRITSSSKVNLKNTRINVNRFVEELENEIYCPIRYLT